jgi:ubiquinone/menaquinone biosynthesis C-methylase UbiE
MSILDVGCGNRASGTVNVDLYYGETIHRRHEPINMKHIPNFVLADACHLPFKDNSFWVVYSAHTIEHVQNPFLMLSELVRVSKHKIIVKCPHVIGENRASRYSLAHLHHFRARWFWDSFRRLPVLKPTIFYSKYQSFPHDWIPLIRLPSEITCIVIKKKN